MKPKVIGYWSTTALVALAFVVPGIGNLVHAPQIAHDMARLGYPSYFLTILGAWKILGAIAITVPRFPRLKEWAYAGMVFDLTGAAVSRAASGDGVGGILPPLAIAAMVITSWALRPRSRRLDLLDPRLRTLGSDAQVSGA
jgi:uncharacterized membrane protein YphA (DoxX/SURF4 family)